MPLRAGASLRSFVQRTSLSQSRAAIAASPLASSNAAGTSSGRASLSTHATVALEKLRSELEAYRRIHYTQCLPSRFKKDLVKVADREGDGNISADGIEVLLRNIGSQGRMTRTEIETIFAEAGSRTDRTIPAARMMQLI